MCCVNVISLSQLLMHVGGKPFTNVGIHLPPHVGMYLNPNTLSKSIFTFMPEPWLQAQG
jgi:hypothetical protein